MISQQNISARTPMGATLVPGGTTFRVWAPRATAVYLNGVFGGKTLNTQTDDLLLAKDDRGYWTGFLAAAAEGDLYRFYVAGGGRADTSATRMRGDWLRMRRFPMEAATYAPARRIRGTMPGLSRPTSRT